MAFVFKIRLCLVIIIENIAAFRAEFRRLSGIFRFPPAFVATVTNITCWCRFTAIVTEFACVGGAAGAGPLGRSCRPGLSAVGAEVSGILCTA